MNIFSQFLFWTPCSVSKLDFLAKARACTPTEQVRGRHSLIELPHHHGVICPHAITSQQRTKIRKREKGEKSCSATLTGSNKK